MEYAIKIPEGVTHMTGLYRRGGSHCTYYWALYAKSENDHVVIAPGDAPQFAGQVIYAHATRHTVSTTPGNGYVMDVRATWTTVYAQQVESRLVMEAQNAK